MRERKIIDLLTGSPLPVKINELTRELMLAERTIRELIRSLNKIGEKHGFRIRMIRNQGYRLEITDATSFEFYRLDLQEQRNQVDLNNKAAPLNELIEKYDPYLSTILPETMVDWYTQADGNLYTIPNYYVSPEMLEQYPDVKKFYNERSNGQIIVRKDIMDQLGITVENDFGQKRRRVRIPLQRSHGYIG
ncbi:HTH domain-containing protein [Paenibacillus lentus]|uniref:HTH domain-containing protein n=1 Tax=Paenibacillus lentus TaxID=1338368 RepID=UPI00365E689A